MRRMIASLFLIGFGCEAHTEPLVTEGFVNAPVAEVWRVFATSEGYLQTGVSQAEVDLRIGGSIRSHHDPRGTLGDEQTLVLDILAYEPERMLALRPRPAPASGAQRAALTDTWSVIYFEASGEDMTHVRIVGLGYGADPDLQPLRERFVEDNRRMLQQIAQRYWPKCALCEKEAGQ